ncbi:SprT-like domain-containing protein [Wenyingzhuangia sp. IMCC45467]
MIDKLLPYIPISSKKDLEELLNNYTFHLKIVNGRKTKRGDFRATKPIASISINNNLSKEQFLITLVHEIAHLDVYLKYPKAKAHGIEWKQSFKRLMLPFLNDTIFSNDILMPLAKHLINAKATTDSDPILATKLQLKNNNLDNDKCFIFDLEPGVLFTLNNRTFKILNKRRTRYECLEISTNKKFLVKGSAPVKIVSH